MAETVTVTSGCNICNSCEADWSVTYRDHGDRGVLYRLVRCRKCRFVFTDPKPEPADLEKRSPVYQEIMREMRQLLGRSLIGRLGMRMMRKSRIPPRDSHRRANSKPSILDVGCSTGEYLAYLRGIGWDVCGVEFDSAAAAHARETLGLDVLTGTAETQLNLLDSGRFDVVTIWHVLEHLDDPRTVLEEVHRVLKPGGSLLIEVPNYSSFWRLLLRENWFPFEYPYHQSHFTAQSLREILLRTGFIVKAIRGEAAPAETIWSWQMIADRLRGRSWDGHLAWSPTGVIALYPIEILLARFLRTNHIRATATVSARQAFVR